MVRLPHWSNLRKPTPLDVLIVDDAPAQSLRNMPAAFPHKYIFPNNLHAKTDRTNAMIWNVRSRMLATVGTQSSFRATPHYRS
jgi:hypothetical protein